MTRILIAFFSRADEICDGRQHRDRSRTYVLGYPNYWGTVPMAVATFLERTEEFSSLPSLHF